MMPRGSTTLPLLFLRTEVARAPPEPEVAAAPQASQAVKAAAVQLMWGLFGGEEKKVEEERPHDPPRDLNLTDDGTYGSG